jgi:hypothetical protein
MTAITDPNLEFFGKIGPMNNAIKDWVMRIAAFQTIGPREMTAIRMSGLGGNLPSTGNDLTNRYAMVNNTAMNVGKMISEKRTARQVARGASPQSFSEGFPRRFFL